MIRYVRNGGSNLTTPTGSHSLITRDGSPALAATGFEFRSCLLVLAFWVSLALCAAAAEVIPPAPDRYCNDYAQVLSAATVQRLNQTLEEFEKSASSQVLVAIYPKMQSDSSLEDYTIRVARAWRVGQKAKNNGAILFVFIQDRKMRIEVGYGLEGALPDVIAKRIIEEQIKPRFQQGDYEGGISAGVNGILQAVRGEYQGTGRTARGRNSPAPVWLFIVVAGFIIFLSIARRSRGTIYQRSGRGTYWGGWGGGTGGGWSSGGGWSGGGSSGGFSGGGGSFGGGGASGSW